PILGRHVAALARAEVAPLTAAVAVQPLELGRLLVARAEAAARVVEYRQQDVVTAPAELGARDLLGEPRLQAERVPHWLGDDRVVLVGTVDLVGRSGHEVAGVGALLSEVGGRDVVAHGARHAVARERAVVLLIGRRRAGPLLQSASPERLSARHLGRRRD